MNTIPILYSCSGCSIAGQYAYRLALYMNETGIAEMSCIAGLASGKKVFLKKTSDREVWIIDGCPIQCAKSIVDKLCIKESKHIKLYELGIKKNKEPDKPVNLEHFSKVALSNTYEGEQKSN